jgi:hypothetical protein
MALRSVPNILAVGPTLVTYYLGYLLRPGYSSRVGYLRYLFILGYASTYSETLYAYYRGIPIDIYILTV